MAKIHILKDNDGDVYLLTSLEAVRNGNGKSLADIIGDLTELVTTDKDSLVEAINEAYNHGGGSSVDIIDDLNSERSDAALSAKQGKILNTGKEDKNYIDEDTSTTAVSEALVVGKTYKYMPSAGVATLAFTLTAPTASDEVKFWRFKFKSGATATEFTPPANLWWAGGESLIPEANTIYEIMIDEDYCVSVLAFKQVTA